MTWLVALLSVPLTIELIGRLAAVRDAWSVPPARPRAIQRLATPVALGAVLWWLAPYAWFGFVIGAGFVLVWRIVAFYALRIALRSPSIQTRSIDTD